MSRLSSAASSTRDRTGETREELEQQLNDARQEKLVAGSVFHHARRHFRRPEADPSSHVLLTKKDFEFKRFPTLEHLEFRLAKRMVDYLEQKVCLKEVEEELNAVGHQLDIQRINHYLRQLNHQTTLEEADKVLRQYERKINAGKESYVSQKDRIEQRIERYRDHFKQLETRSQNVINLCESMMTARKRLVAYYESIVAICEKRLRQSERIARHFKTMKAKTKKSSQRS